MRAPWTRGIRFAVIAIELDSTGYVGVEAEVEILLFRLSGRMSGSWSILFVLYDKIRWYEICAVDA